MKTIFEIKDIANKNVLLRTDFDVPISNKNEIEEIFRIEKQKKMIDWLMDQGVAKVVIVSHLHDENYSFFELIPQIRAILDYDFVFSKTLDQLSQFKNNRLILLENIRKFEGEVNNSQDFAKRLSAGINIYINNAFAVSHRAHASVSAITNFLPSYAGLLLQEEIQQLEKAINAPAKGKVVIMGGAKASTKVPVLKNFIDKAEFILLGGVVANDVLKAKGQDMGSSVVDDNYQDLLSGLNIDDSRLVAPEDFIVFDNKILDIGEKTIQKFLKIIEKANMIIWNGPLGLFENPVFAMGTQKIAEAVAKSRAYKIVGGGDTISAISKFKIPDSEFNFISTGGGAMLAFLAGQRLPGLEALGYYR
jgi:phosphoglycerate kinase